MEILILGSIAIIIALSVIIFYYAFPYILRILVVTPEWLVATIYSLICTYSALIVHDLLFNPLSSALLFITSLIIILLNAKIKSIKSVLAKTTLIIIVAVFVALASIVINPVLWPVSLVMLLGYLFVFYSGWFLLSWLRLHEGQA